MALDRSLALFVSLLVSGCSLSIQGPDPDRPRHLVPACDSGKGSVALDGLMATALGVGGLAALNEDAEGAGLALLATAGLFVASAVRGNSVANECRAAQGEYNAAYIRAQRQERVGELPRPFEPAVKRQPPAVVAPEPAPTIAKPSPEVASPPPPSRPPAPDPDDDDWSAFWKEVP